MHYRNVPAKPDEYRAQEDKRRVVRFTMWFLAPMLSLAKHERIGQSGPARSNVHRSAAGEVQRRQIVEPAIGIPRPARDWAVDNCGPPEAEDKRRYHSSPFEGAADNNLDLITIVRRFIGPKGTRLTHRACCEDLRLACLQHREYYSDR